jgi:hypothetical protein
MQKGCPGTSILDPDLYDFGPPGSGTVIISTDPNPDPSIIY